MGERPRSDGTFEKRRAAFENEKRGDELKTDEGKKAHLERQKKLAEQDKLARQKFSLEHKAMTPTKEAVEEATRQREEKLAENEKARLLREAAKKRGDAPPGGPAAEAAAPDKKLAKAAAALGAWHALEQMRGLLAEV